MPEQTTEQRLRDIIVEHLGVNPETVLTETNFSQDLGADSLDQVEICMAVEEYFGIEIPDEDVDTLETFGQLVEYITRKTA